VFDSSGNGNHGTISGAQRVAGRFGRGLRFDGVNDLVTVADADSLDLTEAMTLEAWVKPTALGSMWRTVAVKEQPSHLAYALYAGNGKGRPSGHVYTSGDRDVASSSALPLNAWRHLASTWDGRTLRLYVDGSQVASRSLSGRAVASGAPLRFGGNRVWREWFKGLIDEVRIYARALSPTELRADRAAGIGAAVGVQTAAERAPAVKERRSRARRTRARAHRITRRR
jgi:hypothetical protein